MILRTFILVTVSTLALATAAKAGDVDAGGDGPSVFGNVHVSANYMDTSSNGYSNATPSVNFGGKISYEPVGSRFGVQLDLEGMGFAYQWTTPTLPIEGTSTGALSVAHLTFAVNDDFKLGAFGGYETLNQDLTKIIDPTLNYRGQTNLSAASSKLNLGSIGVEALFNLSEEASVQGRIGMMLPQNITQSFTDATTLATTSTYFDITDDKGYLVGFSGRVGLSQAFSMRGDINYFSLQPQSGGYVDHLDTAATGQYIFSSLPLAAYAQAAYQIETSDTSSDINVVTLRTGLTWSFGGPTGTTRGKLFRSAGFGGTLN